MGATVSEINFEQLIAAASKPEMGANLAQAASTADRITSTVETVDKVLASVEKVLDRLDRMGVLAPVVRIAGKQAGVDVDQPLASRMGVTAASPLHQQMFTELNTLSEQQLGEVVLLLRQYYGAKKQQAVEAASDGEGNNA